MIQQIAETKEQSESSRSAKLNNRKKTESKDKTEKARLTKIKQEDSNKKSKTNRNTGN